MEISVDTTVVYEHLEESDKRITVLQGGSRSSKTHNTLLWLAIAYCAKNKNKGKIISVVRQSLPALKRSVMRDFFTIIGEMGLYSQDNHNKTDSFYNLWGNIIEFFSADDDQKIRGPGRDVLFVNECNELTWDKVLQLMMRTREKIIFDFNPSEDFWIFDKVIPRDDCDFLKTTYKDNPFLPEAQIREIERLRDIDEFFWRVYGEGELAAIQGVVFTNWEIQDFDHENAGMDLYGYGLDFGFTHDPTAFIEVRIYDGKLWLRELVYETGLTNPDIYDKIKDYKGDIIADSAEPKSIEELNRLGLQVIKAEKGPDSIRQGINLLKTYKIVIQAGSTNLIKEFKQYKHKQDKNGEYMNEVVDKWNHGIDAVRYLMQTKKGNSYDWL